MSHLLSLGHFFGLSGPSSTLGLVCGGVATQLVTYSLHATLPLHQILLLSLLSVLKQTSAETDNHRLGTW